MLFASFYILTRCSYDTLSFLPTGHSRPQNNSIIWLDEEVTTVISCQFTPSSATGTVIIGWFLNGEEIAFNGEPQFPGVAFSVEDYQHKMNIISSTLTVMLAASVDEENLIYLNNGRITCFPPGNNDGRAFGMFTTFVSRNSQFMHTFMHTFIYMYMYVHA